MTESNSIIRRYIEVTAFVAIYVGMGYIPGLNDPNIYLLLGIPLMIVFQLFVRKQPLLHLWVRGSDKLSMNVGGIVLTVLLALISLLNLLEFFMSKEKDISIILVSIASVIGAFGAGFTFSKFKWQTWKDLFFCVIIASSLCITYMLICTYMSSDGKLLKFEWAVAIFSFLQYMAFTFVVEEVVFRGMLDSHLHPPNSGRGISSAIYLSVIWGYWHLPICGPLSLTDIAMLPFIHLLLGIPASLYWRKTGNLAIPSFAHSFVDAVRNGLALG